MNVQLIKPQCSGPRHDSSSGFKIAIGTYGHTAAIKKGAIPIEGVDTDFVEVAPIIQAFRRMVRDVEFDICEMAPTTYMIARARGAPYIALPIFVMRRFHHVGGFVVRPDASIRATWADLEGKNVGVRAYSVTTGVWTRGIFVNEFSLDASKVTLGWWTMRSMSRRSNCRKTSFMHRTANRCKAWMASGEIQRWLYRPGRGRPRRSADRQLGHERADGAEPPAPIPNCSRMWSR